MQRSKNRAEHVFLVGDQQVVLPTGMSIADWALEKKTAQNPRIRAYLGSIRLLQGVLESNYSILHCSPERLLEIWRKVREVTEVIETQLRPLLSKPSQIPLLDAARRSAGGALEMLSKETLVELHRLEKEGDARNLVEIRKMLCVCIGKLHAFLQDTFGDLMAHDPRSQHAADYFLSRRFPKDIEEAEWLYSTVEHLTRYLRQVEVARATVLVPLLERMERELIVPVGRQWEAVAAFLGDLVTVLTPKLKEVLALRGIRFDEMETLDRYAGEIPVRCQTALVLHGVGRKAVERMKRTPRSARPEREQSVRDLIDVHSTVAMQIDAGLREVDGCLRDLFSFAPIWLESIGRRRALFLKELSEPAALP